MIGNIVHDAHVDDVKTPQKTRLQNLNPKLIFAIFAITFGPGFQHGYHIGALNILSDDVTDWIRTRDPDHNLTESHLSSIRSLIVAMFSIGGVVGSLFIACVSNRWGRRGGLLVISSISILATLLFSLAKVAGCYELIVTGRFLVGVHAGLTGGICPMFLIEIAPDNLRGGAASVYQLMITIAILTADLFGEVAKGTPHWVLVLVVPIAPVIVQLFTLPFCPESPKYLYFMKNNEFDCEESLAWYRNTWEIQNELGHFKREKELLSSRPEVTLRHMYNQVSYRTPVVVCMLLMIGQQLSGINAVMYYSARILEKLGYSKEDSYISTCIVGGVNVLSTFPGIILIEIMGRRKLLLLSYAGMALVTVLLTITLILEENQFSLQYITMIAILTYIFFFAIGNGPVTWIYPSEIFTQSTRGLGLSLTIPFNWFANVLMGMAFVQAHDVMSFYVFILFIIVDLLMVCFVYSFMPETKNKSSEKLIGLFR